MRTPCRIDTPRDADADCAKARRRDGRPAKRGPDEGCGSTEVALFFFRECSARRIESRIGIRYSERAFVPPRVASPRSPTVLLLGHRLQTHPLEPPLHDLELRLLRVVQQRADLVLRLVRRAWFRPSLSLQLVPVLVPERQPGGGGCVDGARAREARRDLIPAPPAPVPPSRAPPPSPPQARRPRRIRTRPRPR